MVHLLKNSPINTFLIIIIIIFFSLSVNFFELLSCKSHVGVGSWELGQRPSIYSNKLLIKKKEKKICQLVGKIWVSLNLRVYIKF